jgi:hypothetical protein
MDPISLSLGGAWLLGIILTLLNIREKLKPKGPHPLDDRLRDIAVAIRGIQNWKL